MSEIIYKIEIKTTDKLCAGKISSRNPSAFQYQKQLIRGAVQAVQFFDIKQGTDNDVYLKVIGKENKIDFQKMNNKWKNDFERNSLSAFEIVAPPMGKVAFEIIK